MIIFTPGVDRGIGLAGGMHDTVTIEADRADFVDRLARARCIDVDDRNVPERSPPESWVAMFFVMKKLKFSEVTIDCWMRGSEPMERSVMLGIAPVGSRPLIR